MKIVLLLGIFAIAAVYADHHHHFLRQTRQCEVGDEFKAALSDCVRDMHQHVARMLTENENEDSPQDGDLESEDDTAQSGGRFRRGPGFRHFRRHGSSRRWSSANIQQKLAKVSARTFQTKISTSAFFKNSQYVNCAFKRVGVIGEDFQFNQEEAINLVEEATIPAEKKEVLKDMISDCVNAHAGASTASPILECVHTSFRLVCLSIPTQTESSTTEGQINADA